MYSPGPPTYPGPHTHTASKWAMPLWALTLAQPLCVPLHTRAAGHLGAWRPHSHILSCPIEQQFVAVQCPCARVMVSTGIRKRNYQWPNPVILDPTPQSSLPHPVASDSDGAPAPNSHCGMITDVYFYYARSLRVSCSGVIQVGLRVSSLCQPLTRVEIEALVLQAQGPQALRVLIPEVGGHKDPVVIASATDVEGSGADRWGWGKRVMTIVMKDPLNHSKCLTAMPSAACRSGPHRTGHPCAGHA